FLRILVDHRGVGMGRRVVGIEPVIFDILAMIALQIGEAKGAFLEDAVLAVPEAQGEADDLIAVAPACQPVLIPAIRAAARLLKWKVVPGVAIGRVILAHRAPGALAQIRAPAPPVLRVRIRRIESRALGGRRLIWRAALRLRVPTAHTSTSAGLHGRHPTSTT